MLPVVTGMTGMHHHAQLFSAEMGVSQSICQGWPGTTILSISARITGVNYQHLAWTVPFFISLRKLNIMVEN
jgi:hypothetical protein